MRSLKQERKPHGARGKTGRGATRGVTRDATRQQAFGRRTKPPGLVARFFKRLRQHLIFRRPMLLMTLAIIALTLLAGLFASGVIGRTVHRTDMAVSAVIADAGFGIANVHLSGNTRTSQVTIMAALGFTAGQSIFGADLRAVRERLLGLPWVADAEVKRRYPDDISVRLVEKLPYARWQSANGQYVVERAGGLITDKDLGPFQHLPLLVGDGAPAAAAAFVDAVAQHRAIVARVKAYQYQSGRRWNLLLDDGVVVKLPEFGWQKQLDVLDHLIVDKGILEDDIREIDLRSATHYFFVRKTGEDKKPEAGSAI
ncbi:MAG: FtsQ-type POTRA domain-containing protein [Rhizomicrobium sp.]